MYISIGIDFSQENATLLSMSSRPTSAAAIAAALVQNWKEAIRINTALIKEDNDNIDTLNRLGFAYLNAGQMKQAKKFFEKVLALDQYNHIALKNLKKLSSVKRKDILSTTRSGVSPMMFLEEPGKTKIVSCVNLAPRQVISTLACGEEVFIRAKNHCIEIRNSLNTYLGALPDDLSYKLIKFLSGGNQYNAVVKGIGKNSLTIFLRELSRGKRFAHQPSFINQLQYAPYGHSGSTSVDVPYVTPASEEDMEETRASDER